MVSMAYPFYNMYLGGRYAPGPLDSLPTFSMTAILKGSRTFFESFRSAEPKVALYDVLLVDCSILPMELYKFLDSRLTMSL